MRRRAGWLIVPADRHLSVTARRDVGVDGPRRHRCARMRSLRSQTREPSVDNLIRIGMDTSKYVQTLRSLNTPR
jgi:hypothetical protein